MENFTIIQGFSAKEDYELEKIYQNHIKGKNYINPITLSKEFNRSINYTFLILNKLVKFNRLERIYEFKCPDLSCSKQYRNLTYINLPNITKCNCSNKEYKTREHLYVIYKVL